MAEDVTELFDGPIPGASLTEELGSEVNERPPVYTDPTEAYDYVVDRLMGEKAMERVSMAVRLGIPAELITRSIVFSGWAQGYYTIDIMLLIIGPVFEVITALLDKAGVKYEKLARRKVDDSLEAAFEELERREGMEEVEEPIEDEMEEPEEQMEIEEELEEVPSTGLMGRKE